MSVKEVRVMAGEQMPYLVANPHYYLEHGFKWMDELDEEGLGEVEVRTDFSIPYGEVHLVRHDGVKKVFELKNGSLRE